MRLILLIHRYLGIAVGALMTLWCLSGFVMMYQAYPELTEAERLAGLAPLDLSGCCEPGPFDLDPASPSPAFRVEMLNGEPVLRLGGPRPLGAVGLVTGEPLRELEGAEVLRVAAEYGRGHGIAGEPRPLGIVDEDQWTVQTAWRNQPAHHIAFDDAAGTEIYVSGSTGQVFQDTTRRERVLTWLGAIPHWLYPLVLRRNGPLWSEIVIWASVVGTFLTVTGLYVGFTRFVHARKRNRVSPYRGWWYWHHMAGLVFGVLTLTWVFSGLMTMSPWGVFEGGTEYGSGIRGQGRWGDTLRFLDASRDALPAGEFVKLESAPFGDRLYVVATRADGSAVRLDAEARPAPMTRAEVEQAIGEALARSVGNSVGESGEESVAGPAPIAELELMHTEDSFYYGHKRTVELPVYRAILNDDEATRLYVSPTRGAVRTVGPSRRAARWIRTGLHDLDFAGLRTRPVWDIVVAVLLAGVTVVCATGTWMGIRRIRADFRRAVRRFRQRPALHAQATKPS